jgi:DNA-directed RNA polymerase subunit RPC12/RpoP
MLRVSRTWIDAVDEEYTGFSESVERWEASQLPRCPHCGSDETAKVSAGLVGRSIRLAAATTKIRLLANGHPADYYCNRCKSYFNENEGEHGGPKHKGGGFTIPGRVVVKALETPEAMRALHQEICEELGIAPVPLVPADPQRPTE